MRHREKRDSCLVEQTAISLIVVAISFAIIITIAWAAEDSMSCLSATGEDAITPCRQELLRDPGNLEIRFALSDAFITLGRYEDAVAVLRAGLERFPDNDRITRKLLLAESYQGEKQLIEKQKNLDNASSHSNKQNVQIRLSIIRCEKLKGEAAIAACNEGLKLNPKQTELLTGRGNAWMDMDRFGNAILDYEAVMNIDPGNRDAAEKLRVVQTKRKVRMAQCFQLDGLNGLNACDAVLLRGAEDEFAVQKRRAALLQKIGRKNEAMEAYRAAAVLNPADDQIKRALAALTSRSDKKVDRKAPETFPIADDKTVSPTSKKPPTPEKTATTIPVTPVTQPIESTVGEPEPPVEPSSAKKINLPEVQKPVQDIAQNKPRQYSNAPEVPGIAH